MNTTRSLFRHAAWAVVVVLPAWPGAGTAASAWQDLDAVRAVAESAVLERESPAGGQVRATAAALDARLKLVACDRPLEGTAPAGSRTSARVTVDVRCPGTTPWRVYVPVTVTVERQVVVTAQPLERGRLLAASDVILATRDSTLTATGYLTDPGAAVGRVLRRPLPAGAVLGPASLEAPVVVRRGQTVSLEARRGGIAVSMAGVAQADGALGQVIPVRNVQSRKLLQGIVRNEKSVEIRLP